MSAAASCANPEGLTVPFGLVACAAAAAGRISCPWRYYLSRIVRMHSISALACLFMRVAPLFLTPVATVTGAVKPLHIFTEEAPRARPSRTWLSMGQQVLVLLLAYLLGSVTVLSPLRCSL